MLGLRRSARLAVDLGGLPAHRGGRGSSSVGIGSPWAPPSHLLPIVMDDLFGLQNWPVSRAEAMSVPAIARARNLLCGLIGRLELQAVDRASSTPLPEQPTWIGRTDTIQPAYQRAVWTVDDLIFHGESLWLVDRGADGWPVLADHVPYDEWAIDDDYRITIDSVDVQPGTAIYIPGMHEGVLNFGAGAIRQAADLDRTARDTAHNPFKLELKQTAGDALDDTEIAGLIARAKQALAENTGVLYTNQSVEAIVHEYAASNLLLEGRNYSAVDMARLVGVPAATVDAVLSGSGITYQTGPTLNRALVEYGASMYLTPISSRLSQNDVTPNGQLVAFDLEAYLGPLGPTSELTPSTPSEGTTA